MGQRRDAEIEQTKDDIMIAAGGDLDALLDALLEQVERGSKSQEQAKQKMRECVDWLMEGVSDTIAEYRWRRHEVAIWASYCMGGCYGDYSPEARAIYGRVMRDDKVFEFYRQTLAERTAERPTNPANVDGDVPF
jgi:hypothetical protein